MIPLKPAFLIALGGVGLTIAGCAWPSDAPIDEIAPPDRAITRRHATGLAEGCAIPAAEMNVLASPDPRRVLDEIVLSCAAAGLDGQLRTPAAGERQALAAQIESLRALGYKVSIAVAASHDAAGNDPSSYDLGRLMSQEPARSTLLAGVTSLLAIADGVDINLGAADPTLRFEIGDFLEDVKRAKKPDQTLSVSVGSSVTFELHRIEPWVDRVRVLTIDHPPGSSGWAVDAVRTAIQPPGPECEDDSSCPPMPPAYAGVVDVALPLFGLDTDTVAGTVTRIGFAEAFAHRSGSELLPRDIRGFLSVDYRDASGHAHDVAFDDALGVLLTVRAWEPPVLGPTVGVTYYGVGAEDPTTWTELAHAGRVP